MEDMLRSMLVGREEDWDMQTILAFIHKQISNTSNYLLMSCEVRLPERLLYGPTTQESTSKEGYAKELAERMETVHDKLKRR